MNFGLANPELTVARTHNSTFATDGVSCAAGNRKFSSPNLRFVLPIPAFAKPKTLVRILQNDTPELKRQKFEFTI